MSARAGCRESVDRISEVRTCRNFDHHLFEVLTVFAAAPYSHLPSHDPNSDPNPHPNPYPNHNPNPNSNPKTTRLDFTRLT